ncbi:Glu/Leu/Phe/Val dehydrogenase family protein [Pseudomonas typographi]|uniref:Amino acid dehydrogenase n=1 Tax=Pseudomonas typographi TaxID=2715964 RepID=A0ABR7YYR6_9PSED|nr:Glu/Leu/Phe/Val dehydrogenase family protein [Pseudomonas typographi]MBD1550833.1 amino acid dehydrogenase [Pseudomonas typographi]MBD1587775.1 amino acid dehydrogenase [Pseudomonas typographi]MBD1598298.1 amino acid dehydrogenase [Pseudomonas typographi]
MFALMQDARVQNLQVIVDPASGLRAVVAIHGGRYSQAVGGCRFLHYSDEASAIAEAVRLAEIMSFKAALAGLDVGGAQAVIMRNAPIENRATLFEAFGCFVERMGGAYVAAIDSGTSTEDMDCVAVHTQHVTCTRGTGDTSRPTAEGVFCGIRAAALARLGSSDLQGLRVGVQGLGHIGYTLANLLHGAGAELLASDVDPGRVQLAIEQFDARPVAAERMACTPCDIFVPCSISTVLTAQAVGHLRCAAVAGCANGQLANLTVADQLEARGILYAPDYVINAGGLIHAALSHRGEGLAQVSQYLEGIGKRLTGIFAQAQAQHRSPARVAQEMAERLVYG